MPFANGYWLKADESRIVAVCTACIGLGALLGFLPGYLATTIGNDLQISRGEVGLLVSVYFGCTGIGSKLAGRATEKFGARNVVMADMAAVAFAAFLSALFGSYLALLIATIVGGFGYALSNAGTNVAIGNNVSSERLTLAMSIKTSGVPIMALVLAALGPWAATESSWETVTMISGCFAAVASLAALFFLPDDRPSSTTKKSVMELPKGFSLFSVGAFLLIAGSQPIYSWIVAYMEETLETAPSLAGIVSATASACGVFFMVTNASRADRIGAERRMRRIVRLHFWIVIGIVAILLGSSLGLWIVVLGAVVSVSVQLAAIGTLHAAVVDKAPHNVARATGSMMTGYYLGALASPAAFGWLVDATGTFAYSWLGSALLITMAIPVWNMAGKTGR